MILNIVKEEFLRIGKKTTVCLLTIDNGFEVLGTSHCVNPKHFDEEVGREWAKKDAMDKVEMLDGFVRQQKLYGVDDDEYVAWVRACSKCSANQSICPYETHKDCHLYKNELNNIRRWKY